MAFWRTFQADLAPAPSVNVGIVGTRVCDWAAWADSLVVPFHPRAIVVYVGANDFAARLPKSPAVIAGDLIALFDSFFERLGLVEVFFVSIAPTRKYWGQWADIDRCNEMVAAEAEQREHLHFIDLAGRLLALGSPPPAHCYRRDGEHLSESGYEIWRGAVCGSIGNVSYV
jgi:lysophospholipase L1-like esterase